MRRIFLFVGAILAVSIFGSSANAGPFGTEMGDNIQKFPTATQVNPFYYKTNVMPKMHSAFESYAFKLHPKTGLCQVSGISFDFDNDKYGSKLRQSFAELRG